MAKGKKTAKAAVRADRKISRKAMAHGKRPTVRAAGALAQLADQPPLAILCLATIAGGVVLRRPDIARTGIRMLASHGVTIAIKTLVKRSVDRTRPDTARAKGHHIGRGTRDDHDVNSFPSGHTAGAVTLARAIARDHPAAAVPAYAVSAGVAAALVPSGKHYPIDTIAGAGVGIVGEWAASAALRVAEAALVRVRPLQPSAHRPDRSSPT